MICLIDKLLLEYQRPSNFEQFDTSFDQIDWKMSMQW